MPSKSPAQARLMAAAAHDPAFAARAGVPQGVAQEFNDADAQSDAPTVVPGKKLANALRADGAKKRGNGNR